MFALVYSVGYLVFLFLYSLADTCDMTSLCSRESPFRHFTYKGLVTPFEYFTVGLVFANVASFQSILLESKHSFSLDDPFYPYEVFGVSGF